jgi:D-alanyl-D-alanine dipeptidase
MKAIISILALIMLQACSDNKILSIVDPKVLAIPIKENHEPLIDLKDQNIIVFGPSPEIPDNTDYTKLRVSVYKKLVEAQKLLPDNLKFRLYEGYRSLQLQEKLFNNRYQELEIKYPSWNKERIFTETVKLVSPVINFDGSKNIPAHSTGGAFDIYLIDEKGELMDMGIETKDWAKDTDGSISQTDSKNISEQAQKYRKIMSEVLTKVGFVNYPTEYWHWSYGDRYWAYNKKEPFALYDSANE